MGRPGQHARQSELLDMINDHHGWLCRTERAVQQIVAGVFDEAKRRNARMAQPAERMTKAIYGTGRIVVRVHADE